MNNSSPHFHLHPADNSAVIEHIISDFNIEIDKGLSADLKYISSKFLYDDAGSLLFQKIIQMPEYYPTACEFEILSFQSEAIIESLEFDEPFNIVEFGAGDGIKTKQLLKKLLEQGREITYIPVDISEKAIRILEESLKKSLPDLDIQPFIGDYFTIYNQLIINSKPNLFLFLGSNLGNYKSSEANLLLQHFGSLMNSDDKLLIGLDLMKDPKVIRNAYDDPYGITKDFNINLLRRINRECGANFQLNQFDFYCHYDPISGAVKSYITSLNDQKVVFKTTGKTYHFSRNEVIFTELSQKYNLLDISEMATSNGFSPIRNFLDCKHYFVDSLWKK